ncbi:MAG: TRAP transporter small permease subunit [Gammaproteobacteria bacterium]|nr:TRAP transporter small permease subunit [Gammaproteobacteria bacterium]
MPELSFVLPHWLYWSGLLLFPLITLLLYRRSRQHPTASTLSLPLAYVLLVVGGFLGIHRLYLKSRWALAFVLVFISVLMVNVEVRDMRNNLSQANNAVAIAEHKIKRAEKRVAKKRRNAEQKLEQARQSLVDAQAEQVVARGNQEHWEKISSGVGGLLLLLILADFLMLPQLVRRVGEAEQPAAEAGFHCPVVEAERDDKQEPFLFNRWVSQINGTVGEFVAYWSLLAVLVYYYEVIARYVFNSPTNWAHESMFLMFGMQYLIAGGFVLREGAHVRVDVVYTHLSNRGRAIVDLFTSIFFFIFMLTLMVTGWTFFMDAYKVGEVSFTEWGIQYWPIKFALPLGAALLLLQGIALLLKDIAVVINPALAELESEVRPEG